MADSTMSLGIPETDHTPVSGVSSALESGLGDSVPSVPTVLSPTSPVSALSIAGAVSSVPTFTGTMSSETTSTNPAVTENQGRATRSTPIFGLPTPCSSALGQVQPAVTCPGTSLEGNVTWSSDGSSRFGGLGHDSGLFASFFIKSVDAGDQKMDHVVQQLSQSDGPAENRPGMADNVFAIKPCADHSVDQQRRDQQCLRSHCLQPVVQTPVPQETRPFAPLSGMELLGDLAMVDNQGNQVSKASTQAQISQAHALRAGIERSEFQRAQFCLQRAQRAHSQQPVVTLPADFEQAITRLISSASQNRYPSLEKSPQIPSLFQRVLSELNSVHGTSQDDGQTLPRLGEQEPHNSIIGDDYAMTECGGYLSSIQKPWSTFSPGGARSTIENCTNQQPPRETNTADDHALIGGFDTETVIHNPLPQSDAMGIFPGSFTGLPTGLSITESSVDSPGRQTMPPEPVVRLPTSCNPTLVKKQSIVSFQLPPDVSSTSSAALNMDDCIPSSPEDCKWSLSGQNDYNMASGGQDSMSIQGVSAPPVSDQILVDPLVPDAARGSQFQPVTSIDPLAQWKRVGVLDNNSSSLNRNPNDLGHLTGQALGSIAVRSLGDNQVLFIFNMLDFMANLQPRYEYKYGGSKGTKIGVKLVLWGHTVVIAPINETLHDARVSACREALEQLREFNTMWQIPPQPMDGPTSPSWNWVEMLEVYRMVQKWSEPRYLPVKDDSSWHCDVYVDRKLFRTVKPVPTLEEAHNTVAHLAMHQIMVGRGYDHNCLILPTDERATATPAIEKRIASLLRSNTDPPKKIGTIVQYAGVTKPKVQLKSTASIKSQVTFRAPSTAPRAKSWKTSPESTQPANISLSTLKTVAKVLSELNEQASFTTIKEKLCDALKCEQPHIIVNQLSKKLNGPKNAREVLAQFRDGPPYLKQARPIHLAYVVTKSHDAAKVLGFKQLILFILNMVKDAGEGDHRCSRELVILKAFEDECKQALGSHRMSGKFFVL